MSSHCASCGASTSESDRFCRNCGAAQPGPHETAAESTGVVALHDSGELPLLETTGALSLGIGQAALVVTRGPGAGEFYLLTGDIITVGRAPDSGIFLDDVTVSRHHAEFRRDGEDWVVRDASSLNGTYVNRDRIDEHLLVDHDEVQIGKYRFGYRVGPTEGRS